MAKARCAELGRLPLEGTVQRAARLRYPRQLCEASRTSLLDMYYGLYDGLVLPGSLLGVIGKVRQRATESTPERGYCFPQARPSVSLVLGVGEVNGKPAFFPFAFACGAATKFNRSGERRCTLPESRSQIRLGHALGLEGGWVGRGDETRIPKRGRLSRWSGRPRVTKQEMILEWISGLKAWRSFTFAGALGRLLIVHFTYLGVRFFGYHD